MLYHNSVKINKCGMKEPTAIVSWCETRCTCITVLKDKEKRGENDSL